MNNPVRNKKRLLIALEKNLGIVTNACKSVKIDRSTFYKYYKTDSRFRAKVDELDNIALDFVESQLFKQIKDNIPSSTIFYLKTKGRNRGYVEKIEVEQTITEPIEFIISKPEKSNIKINGKSTNDK